MDRMKQKMMKLKINQFKGGSKNKIETWHNLLALKNLESLMTSLDGF